MAQVESSADMEDLADILTTISVISKRLAQKLRIQAKNDSQTQKGVNTNGKDE